MLLPSRSRNPAAPANRRVSLPPVRIRDAPSPSARILPPASQTVQVNVQERYFDAIAAGTKTWEGRINHGRFAGIRVGDKLVFCTNGKPGQTVTKFVGRIETSSSFSDMLQGKVSLFLPGTTTLEDGVQIYNSIPGYRKKVSEHGTTAFALSDAAPPRPRIRSRTA